MQKGRKQPQQEFRLVMPLPFALERWKKKLIGNCFFKVLFRGVGPAGFEGVQLLRFQDRAELVDTIDHAAASRCDPGEQTVPRSGAGRAGGVGVGEKHPLAGEPVDVGSDDLRLRVVGAAVAVTHVVRQDDDDVRFLGGPRRKSDRQGEK